MKRASKNCKCGHPIAWHDSLGCSHGRGHVMGGCSCTRTRGIATDALAPLRAAGYAFVDALVEAMRPAETSARSRSYDPEKPSKFHTTPLLDFVDTPRPPKPPKQPKPKQEPVDGLPSGAVRLLTAIAQTGDEGATHAQLAVLTGYKSRSVTNYLSMLRTGGLIYRDRLVATSEGISKLGSSYESLPTGDDLRAYWTSRLSGGELSLFEAFLSAYPGAMSHEQLCIATKYSERSVTNYVSKLKSRKLIEKQVRAWRASDTLFSRPQRRSA